MPRLAREVEPILRHKTEGKYKTRIIDYEKIIPSYTQLSSNNLRNSATIIKLVGGRGKFLRCRQ